MKAGMKKGDSTTDPTEIRRRQEVHEQPGDWSDNSGLADSQTDTSN